VDPTGADIDGLRIAIWIASVIAASIVFRRVTGRPIRAVAPGNSSFVETRASGRSLRKIISRIGGARNCLMVAVTTSKLVICPQFPFTLMFLPEIYGLEIDVPRSRIKDVRIEKGFFSRRVVVDYLSAHGASRSFELRLSDPDAFRKALTN